MNLFSKAFRLLLFRFLGAVFGIILIWAVCIGKTREAFLVSAPDPDLSTRNHNESEKRLFSKEEDPCSFESPIFPDSVCNGLVNTDFRSYRELIDSFETKGARASISLTVVDENGSPVPFANVCVSFTRPGGEGHHDDKSGTTDATGRFHAEGISCWSVACRAEKNGFYACATNLLLRPFASAKGLEEGRWFRSSYPVRAVLKRKESPHEMRFHDVKLPLPAPGKPVGFDLVEGMPTPPYGAGKHTDVEFVAFFNPEDWKSHSRQNRESVIRISFPGSGNGGMLTTMDESSELHTPRLSPESGYSASLESVICVIEGRLTNRNMILPDQYVLFRVRSEVRPDGSTTNGLFGKMRGDWYVNGSKRRLCFRTWLNEEPGNRNLEDTGGRR